MALRDQPYIPLYIQDFLTDEKLIECSAQATGVYIRLICIMHKSEEYGKILLKQKDEQTSEQVSNFASKLAKQMPYPVGVVHSALNELLAEKVLHIQGNFLCQKRMIRDNQISLVRSKAGKKGGSFAQAKNKAKPQANSENESAIEIDDENKLKGAEKDFSKPDVNGDEIIFPVDTKAIREAWAKWKEYRLKTHDKTYPMYGEQSALKQLEKMNEQEILNTIFKAIESNWLNLYPDRNGNNKGNFNGFSTKSRSGDYSEQL